MPAGFPFERAAAQSWLRRNAALLGIAAVILCATLLLGYVADQVNNERHLNAVRAQTHQQLSQAGERLHANLQADLQLVRGLVSVINLMPDLDQAQFDKAVQPLFEGRTQLRNIAAAPDLVIRLMHPVAGNERALGLDYRAVPSQLAAAERARDSGEVVLAGPLTLVQGGTGLIARLPVFVADGQGRRRFWGLVSAVIDSDRLFRSSGILDSDGPYEFALRGLDRSGPQGEVFVGRSSLFDDRPVQIELPLPQGSWLLAAMPRGGWPARADNAGAVRLGLAMVGIVLLFFVAALARAVAKTDAAQRKAEAAGARLATLIEQSPDAMLSVDQDGRIVLANRQTEALFGWSRAELLGQPVEKLLPSPLRAPHAALQERYFAALAVSDESSVRHPRDLQGLHKDGSLIDVEISLSPMVTEEGTLVTSVIRDSRRRKDAEARALASERRISAIADNLPVLISHFDRDERYLFANAYFGQVFGVDHRSLIGRTLHEFRGDAVYAQVEPHVRSVLAGQASTFDSHAVIDGKQHYFHQHYVPDIDADGQVQGFYSVSVDMSALKSSELRAAHSEKRLRMIADNLPALISHIDTQHRFTFANATWLEIFGVRPQDMVGRHIREAMGDVYYESRRTHVEVALAQGRRVQFDSVVEVGGHPRYLHVTLMPDLSETQQVVGIYTLGLDVTAQKELEAKLEVEASVDHLTNLPNRRGLELKLEEAAARTRRSKDLLAVMYVDVDHFKQVNDQRGHEAGDLVLQAVAQRLVACVRTTDTVARLGGDEFVVLLEGLQDAAEADTVAEKIVACVRQGISLADGLAHVSASIGISTYDGADPAQTIASARKHADAALYEAKWAGRDCYRRLGTQDT